MMYRCAACLLILVWLVRVATAAEPLVHPAERAFSTKVDKAKAAFDREVDAAREELKKELEKAVLAATMAGELDKAIALRERGKAIIPEKPAPLVADTALEGRYVFTYTNGVVRDYQFGKDGALSQLAEGGIPFDKPRQAKVSWQRHGDLTVGLIFWGTRSEIETLTVTKDGVGILHFAPAGAIRARGERAK